MSDSDMAQVMVVDDDKGNRELHVLALEQAGIPAVGVESALDALKQLEDVTEIEAVLLDLSMPVMDGLTAADEIRANEAIHPEKKPVHLAFLTAQTIEPSDERNAERNNVEQIIQKDGDIFALPDKVRQLLCEDE